MEHQDRVIQGGSTIAYHSLGSGKTYTGLKSIERAVDSGGKGLFVAPASLVENARKEVAKHKVNIGDSEIVSYDKVVRNPHLFNENYDVLVLDEFHRLRNPGKRRSVLNKIRKNSGKAVGLTGSVMYNDVSDVAPLVNTVADEKVLPEGKKDFHQTFIGEREIPTPLLERLRHGSRGIESFIKNEDKLKDILDRHIDRYDTPQSSEDFPDKTEEVVPVEMSEYQQKIYNFAMGQMPPDLKDKVKRGVALSRSDVAKLQMFSTGPRLAALSSAYIDKERDESPKLDEAVRRVSEGLEKDRFKALVYSNYIEGGVEPYIRRLEAAGHGDKIQVFKGGLNNKQRKEIVENYNSGKKPVLVVSSAGSEGLDLKGTRKVQILEPHFNEEKINQVIGRSARYQSHTHLPEEERNVHVERYISKTRKGWVKDTEHTVDGSLLASARDKAKLIDKARALMEKKAVVGAVAGGALSWMAQNAIGMPIAKSKKFKKSVGEAALAGLQGKAYNRTVKSRLGDAARGVLAPEVNLARNNAYEAGVKLRKSDRKSSIIASLQAKGRGDLLKKIRMDDHPAARAVKSLDTDMDIVKRVKGMKSGHKAPSSTKAALAGNAAIAAIPGGASTALVNVGKIGASTERFSNSKIGKAVNKKFLTDPAKSNATRGATGKSFDKNKYNIDRLVVNPFTAEANKMAYEAGKKVSKLPR